MIVIQDTRERTPWLFDEIAGVAEVRVQTMATGDYTLDGHEHIVCVERKSLADFAGSVTRGHDRFYRELERMQAFPVRAVIVECSVRRVANNKYRSKLSPKALMAHAMTITFERQIPVLFAGSRYEAQVLAFTMFRHAEKVAKQVDSPRRSA